MTNSLKLIAVKVVHTLIWIFFNLVLIYMFFAAYYDQVDHWFWIGNGLIGLECLVLVLNNWSCPLTPIARRYTDDPKDNFDIYLPNWIAKNNKTIYTLFFIILWAVYFIRVS